MSILKKLASQTAIYGISSNFGRLLNYALVPFHTYIFAPEQYGIISDFYAKAAFFNVIYTYGMETAYFRFTSKKTPDEQQTVYNQVLSCLLLTSFCLSLLLVLGAVPLARLMSYPDNFSQHIILFACLFAIDTIVVIPFAKIRQEQKAKLFALVKISSIVANVLLNFFFLWVFKKWIDKESTSLLSSIFYSYDDVFYVFLANFLGNFLAIPLLWSYFLRWRWAFSWQTLRPILLYAYPILFTGLAAMINEVLSRDFIKYWLPDGFYPNRSNLEAVGIFSACYKFSIFITLAVQAFKYAAEPFFFAQAQDKNSPIVFAHVTKYFNVALTIMFVGISLNIDLVKTLVLGKTDYEEGLVIVPFLLLANLFLGIYYNISVWFKITDHTAYGTLLGFLGAGITIIGNLALIPLWGYLGSAITTLICYATMMILCYYWGQKYYPVPYPIVHALSYWAVGVVFVSIGWYVKFPAFWYNQLWHFVLTGLFVGGALAVEWKQRSRVK
jgi:O-antigen/teichoic acid export membrane protein